MRYRTILKAQRHLPICNAAYICDNLSLRGPLGTYHDTVHSVRFLSTRLNPPLQARKRSLSRVLHHEDIRQLCRTWYRSQHAQAIQEEPIPESDHNGDNRQDDVEASQENEVQDDTTISIANISLVNELEEMLRQIVKSKGKKSSCLFRLIKRLPYSAPNIQLRGFEQQDKGNDSSIPYQDLCVEIANEYFEISFQHTVPLSEQSQTSLEDVFEGVAYEYVLQVIERLKIFEVPKEYKRSYARPVLQQMLNLQEISVDCTLVELKNDLGHTLTLYRAKASFGDDLISQLQMWPKSRYAKLFALSSADAEILKLAEQVGIDLAVVDRSDLTSKRNVARVTKTKRPPTELERVDYKDNPAIYNASISQHCLLSMMYTLAEAHRSSLPHEVPLRPFQKQPETTLRLGPSQKAMQRRSRALKRQLLQGQVSTELRAIRKTRDELPIRRPDTVAQICKTVEVNDVVILISETGSGKTTQVPQILLEEAIATDQGAWCNITCTQPRRIAATSVATRVAQEFGTIVGDIVGYQVRFDHKSPPRTGSITYATAGVLLKSLQDESDEILDGLSHIVVDEIHERDLTVDLLLALLRDLMKHRKQRGKTFPKIILMSATLKSKDFERYFSQEINGSIPRVAAITISGRAYPVIPHMLDDIIPLLAKKYSSDDQMVSLLRASQRYLRWEDEYVDWLNGEAAQSSAPEDALGQEQFVSEKQQAVDPYREAEIPQSLMMATIAHALASDKKGDILVFLPGMREIESLATMLSTNAPLDLQFNDPDKIRIFKLHSVLYETNAEVFKPVPEGCRRIILATNIAQTSLTLPNVVHVIDSGKRRQMVYEQVDRKSDFTSTWIDQATSIQRRGRAGRVQSGHYWAMFTDARFKSMPKHAKPELLSTDLVQPCLILKSHSDNIDLHEFFERTLDPPSSRVVDACINELEEMGMLTKEGRITPMGKFCAEFPLHPAKARGLLLSFLFGCVEPMLIMVSHDRDTPLIFSAMSKRDMYENTLYFADSIEDDRYAVINAFRQYDAAFQRGLSKDIEDLRSKCVKHNAYMDMLYTGRQLYEIAAEHGFANLFELAKSSPMSSVFQLMDPRWNMNSGGIPLFKALALTAVNANLAVWNEKEQSWLAKNLKCMLRPFSVNTLQSLKLQQRPTLRKEGELIAFNSMVRNSLSGNRPFLTETSSITPLTAILFGGPIAMVDHDTIEVNGWLRYKIQLHRTKDETPKKTSDLPSPAQVIVEFRKMLDRFIVLACSQLVNGERMRLRYGRPKTRNTFFYPDPLRDAVREGLIAVLEHDAYHWENVALVTPEEKKTETSHEETVNASQEDEKTEVSTDEEEETSQEAENYL